MPSITCKNVHILMTITILVWFMGLGANGFNEVPVWITIDPLVVQPTNSCTLTCSYDLRVSDHREQLYSLKWYREQREFFRYTHSDQPQIKVFPMREIHVDVAQSNATQVVLRDVSLASSGTFICELTYESTLTSRSAETNLTVVPFPETLPLMTVRTPHSGFADGEVLSADCKAAPSKPAPTLRFILNNKTVSAFPKNKPGEDPSIQMNLILSEEDVCNEILVLWCEASIDDVYEDHVEMILPATAKTDCMESKDGKEVQESIHDPPTMNITVEYTGPIKKVTASCKSPRSRPPARLQFVLNNNTIGDLHVATKESTHHSWAELVLNDVLPEEMMNHNVGILRCKTNTINDEHSTYVEENI